MSRLRIFPDHYPSNPELTSIDFATIARALNEKGIRFERWNTKAEIKPGDTSEKVIAAYQSDIDRLMQENGYQTVDVISLSSDHPDKAALRQKFLSEHTHSEDEVRFFVAGQGLFILHLDDKIYEVLCEQGDLIGVPDNTKHWFDMGPNPNFVAIRLFTNPAGWVAEYTGNKIADQFPRLDN